MWQLKSISPCIVIQLKYITAIMVQEVKTLVILVPQSNAASLSLSIVLSTVFFACSIVLHAVNTVEGLETRPLVSQVRWP